MNATVKERIISGYYRIGNHRYDPILEYQLSKVQVLKLTKAGCPIELIKPNWEGEPAFSADREDLASS